MIICCILYETNFFGLYLYIIHTYLTTSHIEAKGKKPALKYKASMDQLPPLPPEWSEHKDSNGSNFYYNSVSK